MESDACTPTVAPEHLDAILTFLQYGDLVDVAIALRLDPERTHRIVERIDQADTASTDHPDGGPEGLGRIVLVAARQVLSAEDTLELFETADLAELIRRWALTAHLLSDVSFLTVDELADVLEEYTEHLGVNRPSLVALGVPLTSLGCSLPGMYLDYLYPTRAIVRESRHVVVDSSTSPTRRSRALLHMPAEKCATWAHEYWWASREATYGMIEVDIASLAKRDKIAAAFEEWEIDLLRDLDSEMAKRLEASRSDLLDLEMAVLRALATELRVAVPDATRLWDQCVHLLTDALPVAQVEFLLAMDRWFHGYDIASGQAEGEGYMCVFPAGLSHLLMLIGHCEKELTIGTLDRTKRAMTRAIPADLPVTSYFQTIGQLWQTDVDRALGGYLDRAGQESAFWDAFQTRVNRVVPGEFKARFIMEMEVQYRLYPALEQQMLMIRDMHQSSIDYTGELPAVQATLKLSSLVTAPMEQENIFRRDGQTWTLRFAGKSVRLQHLNGLAYLAYLLRRRGKSIAVEELDAAIRGNLGPALDSYSALCVGESDPIHPSRIGNADRLTDAKTIKAARVRERELTEELKKAHRSGITKNVTQMESDLALIRQYLRRTVGLRGVPRKENSVRERARTNIQRRIKLAIDRIAREHHELASHLTSSVRTGDFCIYDPALGGQISWTF
jgi:hypothetical protein